MHPQRRTHVWAHTLMRDTHTPAAYVSAGMKRGGVRADGALNGQSIERYMDGARQGKEMRWDTERQRVNMKIYDGIHTYTYLQTMHLNESQ